MDQEKINAARKAQADKKAEAANLAREQQLNDNIVSAVKSNDSTAKDVSGEASNMNAAGALLVENAVTDSGDKVAQEIKTTTKGIQNILEENSRSVADAINNLVVATVITKDPKLVETTQLLTKLLKDLSGATDTFGKSNINELPLTNKALAKAVDNLAKNIQTKEEQDLTPLFDKLQQAITALDIKPVVNIANQPKLDLSPVTKALSQLQGEIKNNKIDVPELDTVSVVAAVQSVQDTLANLKFPVSNYVLPFRNQDGKAVQVQLDANGNVPFANSGGTAATIANGADVAEGATTDAAVVTDTTGTISGKLRGLVKWAFERMPSSLGQKTKANSFPVVIASDQDALPITDNSGSLTVDGTVSLGAGSASVGTLGANSGVDVGDVTINNSAGASAVNIQDGGNSITVDGTVAVSGTVTVDTELPAAAAMSDVLANPTAPAVAAFGMVYSGSTWFRWYAANALSDASTAPPSVAGFIYNGSAYDRVRGATNAVNSVGTGIQAIANLAQFDDTSPTAITENSFGNLRMSSNRNLYGTIRDAAGNERGVNVTAGNSAQSDITSVAGTAVVNGGTAGVLSVGGKDATNVAIGTNPVNNGAQGVSSENTAVTTGRMVQLVADLVGKQIVLPYSNPENFVSGAITSAMTGTTSTSLIAAPASGLRNYITQITVSNAHATVGTDVVIQDGSGGTTLYTIPAAAVYGGAVLTFPVPLRQPTTATAIFCANVTTGASTKVSASGYKGA